MMERGHTGMDMRSLPALEQSLTTILEVGCKELVTRQEQMLFLVRINLDARAGEVARARRQPRAGRTRNAPHRQMRAWRSIRKRRGVERRALRLAPFQARSGE